VSAVAETSAAELAALDAARARVFVALQEAERVTAMLHEQVGDPRVDGVLIRHHCAVLVACAEAYQVVGDHAAAGVFWGLAARAYGSFMEFLAAVDRDIGSFEFADVEDPADRERMQAIHDRCFRVGDEC